MILTYDGGLQPNVYHVAKLGKLVDGIEGLEIVDSEFRRSSPSLLFSDLRRIGTFSGFETAQASHEECRQNPLVLYLVGLFKNHFPLKFSVDFPTHVPCVVQANSFT